MNNKSFEKWALGFSGCDGGNIGSADNNSIWFCGIEWGGKFENELKDIFNTDVSQPTLGYDVWEENLSYIFNWQAMKILSVIAGKKLTEYKSFAKEYKPFVNNSHTNYFKMNLYPIAFKNTSNAHWSEEFAKEIGLLTKYDYINWIRYNRFPVMKTWVSKYKPKLIICVGITYFEDFKQAFMLDDVKVNEETIDAKKFLWFKNSNNTIVINIPFMVNRNGLTRNESIEKFGFRIKELLG